MGRQQGYGLLKLGKRPNLILFRLKTQSQSETGIRKRGVQIDSTTKRLIRLLDLSQLEQ